MKQDFTKRLVIIVRKDLEGWQAANTIAHIASFVGNKLGNSFSTGEEFVFKDGSRIPRNSQYPMIIKSAATSGELTQVLKEASAEGLLYIGFIREMIDSNSDAEIEETLQNKTESEAEYLGVGIFGENEKIKLLTKAFSLWK